MNFPDPDAGTARRVLEFFTANIRNPHTRKAYGKAAGEFAVWCEAHGIAHLRDVQPVHVAAYIEELQRRISAPSVKLQLAGIRMLFDWLVIGQIVPMNPASAVRGPKHSVKKGKTPVLTADEARDLLDSTDTRTPVGLRDRAIIALMTFTFARVGAVLKMRVEDIFDRGARRGCASTKKAASTTRCPATTSSMPTFTRTPRPCKAAAKKHNATLDPKAWLFCTTEGQSGYLTSRQMGQADVYRMIRRRAIDAGIETKIRCHSFRATGITEYLRNGGKLEVAQQMANHESARTTGLYSARFSE